MIPFILMIGIALIVIVFLFWLKFRRRDNVNIGYDESKTESLNAVDTLCTTYLTAMDKAMSEANQHFSSKDLFIEPTLSGEWQSKYEKLLGKVVSSEVKSLEKAKQYDLFLQKRIELLDLLTSFRQRINQHNNTVAEARLPYAYKLLGVVEGQRLDRQQMLCVVKEVHNHLVVAGAGTGKTTTVVGKIKYLLRTEKCRPDDILVLSFTNASATEMCERIRKETGHEIAAMTFHKLGLEIMKNAEGIYPKIVSLDLRDFIKKQLDENMKSAEYLYSLCSYLWYNRVKKKSEFEFETDAEYKEYLKLNPPTTMNHEEVKSYGEMDIANFLFQNDIQYIYEYPYRFDTRTSEHRQYTPDFYLPEYDIYIEYFGVNEKGEVPSWFRSEKGKTASQTYLDSMAWKHKLHKEKGTVMVECYAYEQFGGVLLENLKKKLEEHSVICRPKSSQELWEHVSKENEGILEGVINLFETLISLIKSNAYTLEDVYRLNAERGSHRSNKEILSLLEPIFNAYCSYLQERGEIDFNDMINLSREHIERGNYINPYRYVIVDEYQDISKARFSLLRSLRKSRDFVLFCVGDDWQSIYRFAGSDISFILSFEKYWGAAETSKIETTYRFPQQLIEVSGTFVMNNPAQLRKVMKGRPDEEGFVLSEISGASEKKMMEQIIIQLEGLPKNSSVYFIGRYSFESKLLHECDELECSHNGVTKLTDVVYQNRPDLKMSFLTAHKSKGLQADYVFIINNKNARMGFPSKIQEADILSLLLDNYDDYPYAEERRLYYVALTRAKKKVFIITINNKESEFVMELRKNYGERMTEDIPMCPLCGGKLVKRKGPYGDFIACSNYRVNGCRYREKSKKT